MMKASKTCAYFCKTYVLSNEIKLYIQVEILIVIVNLYKGGFK